MTNEQIKNEIRRLIQSERQNTKQFLNMLRLAQKERSYLEYGYPSLFAWLTGEFKHANGSAQRRLNAIRVLQSVPEAQGKLLNGDLNLTNLNQAQTVFNAQEKISGAKLSDEVKAEAIKEIENKKEDEAQKALLTLFPETALKIKKPRNRRLTQDLTRCTYDFSNEQIESLNRLREVWSHKFPNVGSEELIYQMAEFILNKEDPLRKSTCLPEANGDQKVSKAQTRRQILQSSAGGCTFTHHESGHVCDSHYQIEIDHVQAKGIGGDDSRENQRPLCHKHNIYMAEKTFGKKHMSKFRKTDQLCFDCES